MIVVFLGPPGSGKGTQAQLLRQDHGFFHFDTGSRLREESASGSELGARIASFADKGQLVPIEVIRELIHSFLSTTTAPRIMFDGFPRSLEQGRVLDQELAGVHRGLDHAVYLEISREGLLERIVNRRFCTECGEIYNLVTHPPKGAGVCDRDGGKLVQRKDDTEAVFGTRLEVYLQETSPLLDYYRGQGVLRVVDAARSAELIAADIGAALNLGRHGAA